MLVAKALRDEALKPGRAELSKRLLVIGGGIAGHPGGARRGERRLRGDARRAHADDRRQDGDARQDLPDAGLLGLHPDARSWWTSCSTRRSRLMTSAEVEEVHGFVGNFDVTVRQKARYVDHAICNGCGTCWGKCPVKDVPSEFDQGVGSRTAIYLPFPQAIPNKPVIDAAHCRSIAYREAQARAGGRAGPLAARRPPSSSRWGPTARRCRRAASARSSARRRPIRFDDQDALVDGALRRDRRGERVRPLHARREPRRAPRPRGSASPTTASTATAGIPT